MIPASGVSIRLFSRQSPIILRWDEADVQSNTNGVVVIIIISICGKCKKMDFFRNFPLRGGGVSPAFFLPKFVGPKKVLGRF